VEVEMKISKQEALEWFEYLADVPVDAKEVFEEYEDIIRSTTRQIEKTYMKEIADIQSKIDGLKDMKGRTYYVGKEEKFPPGCISCLFGDGLGGIRKTHTCNLTCEFCYYHDSLDSVDPIPQDMWDIGDELYEPEDIDLLLSIHKKPSGIAYVYLEPFMEIEKYYPIVKKFAKAGVHQHMYTNGTLCTEENLKELANAGLDEIRFNLNASDTSDQVIEAMRIARKYFKWVGIETPMTPKFYDDFMAKKDEILSIGLDFMNCAELHLGTDNLNNYMGENFYTFRNGYLSPLWSRKVTLKFMETAIKENWDMLIHDCSNHTKYAREINKMKNSGQFGAHTYVSEFDRPLISAFLPILRDENFKFIESTPLSAKCRLENCKEHIEEMLDDLNFDDEIYEGFEG
jgi:pyruvate formate-lyase activating enzyme-like uncharacterized protein